MTGGLFPLKIVRCHPPLSPSLTSTGKLIDDALEAVEKENTRNGDLRIASSSSRRRAIRRSPLPNLAGLIDLIANFAWVQHMLHHLTPNGSMSSNSSGEGDIRRALIEADLVECMVALHGHLREQPRMRMSAGRESFC